jgi:hypothetical protein
MAHQVNVEMSKLPLRDGLRQQASVAVDLAPLAVHVGFCLAGESLVRPCQTNLEDTRGQPSRMGNAVQMQKNVFSEFCRDDGTKNSCGNIAN